MKNTKWLFPLLIIPFLSGCNTNPVEDDPITPDPEINFVNLNKVESATNLNLPFITQNDLEIAVEWNNKLSLLIKDTKINDSIKEEDALIRLINDQELKVLDYIEKDNVKAYKIDVNYSDMNKDIVIKNGENSHSINLISYFKQVLSPEKAATDFEKDSFKSLLDNILNFASKATGDSSIAEEISTDYIADNSENYFHSGFNWVQRDNVTYSNTWGSAIEWLAPKYDVINNRLTYEFAIEGVKDLKVYSNEEIKTNIISKDGKMHYTFVMEDGLLGHSSLEHYFYVKQGDELKSTANYSTLRGIGRNHYDADLGDKAKALNSAYYSLEKAATWFLNRNDITRRILDNSFDNGIVTFEYDYFNYEPKVVNPSKGGNYWWSYVYVNGETYDANTNEEQIRDNYTVSYADNKYTVTLKGGTIDGIRCSSNASLKIVVEEDTILESELYRNWGDKNDNVSASIINDSGNIEIVGTKTLTAKGGIISANDLNISGGVTVKALKNRRGSDSDGASGVVANNVNVTDGATLIASGTSNIVMDRSAGVKVNGNLNVNNASLKTSGFANGILLQDKTQAGNEEQKVIFDGESNVEIQGNNYGILSEKCAKELMFNNGNIIVKGNVGTDYCNLTVDAGNVTVESLDGVTIKDSKPVSIKTISSSAEVGTLNLINNSTNQTEYVARVHEMNVDGSIIHMSTKNSSHLLVLAGDGAELILKQSDLFMYSTNFANGIMSNESNTKVTVTSTARIFMENVTIPFATWNPTNPLTIDIQAKAFVEIRNYKFIPASWEADNKVVVNVEREEDYALINKIS